MTEREDWLRSSLRMTDVVGLCSSQDDKTWRAATLAHVTLTTGVKHEIVQLGSHN